MLPCQSLVCGVGVAHGGARDRTNDRSHAKRGRRNTKHNFTARRRHYTLAARSQCTRALQLTSDTPANSQQSGRDKGQRPKNPGARCRETTWVPATSAPCIRVSIHQVLDQTSTQTVTRTLGTAATMGGRRYRTVGLSALLSASVVLAWSPAGSLWSGSARAALPASSGRTTPWTRTKTSRPGCCAPVAGSVEAQQVRAWLLTLVMYLDQVLVWARNPWPVSSRREETSAQPPCGELVESAKIRNSSQPASAGGMMMSRRPNKAELTAPVTSVGPLLLLLVA